MKANYNQDLKRSDVEKINYMLQSEAQFEDIKERFPNFSHGQWGGVGDKNLFGEVGVTNIDKGSAILFYEKHEKLNHKNSIGIGDAASDIPMLQTCEVGIAMGNSPQFVKEIADIVTEDVDQDGLYLAFQKMNLI